jgi:cell division septum initiation protein DivIVA
VARHSFGSVRRGFDPGEVRAYLESLATGLRGVAEREHQLLAELADAEHRAANPVLDEPTLTSALGTETARVLHSAHEVAAEMVAKAEAEADRLLTEGREEIQRTRSQTEARLAEQTAASEAEAEALRQRSEQQAADRVEAAREEAEAILERARAECRGMVDEAQGLRSRVLADLSKRRKVLHAQIEQLRAGRERLAETVQDVRRSVDAIAADLFAAEDNARLAAEAAGREALGRPDEGTPEELAALLLADEGVADEGVADEALPDESPATIGGPADGSAAEGTTEPEGSVPPVAPDAADQADEAEPDAADRPGAEVDDPAPAGGGDDSPVEAVFAKIRAAQVTPEGAGTEAESVPADPPTADKKGKKTKAPSRASAKPAPVVAETAPAPEAPSPEASAPVSPAPATPATPATSATEVEASPDDEEPPDDRHPAAIRRDELIGPIVTALSRRLKRTLQDGQNELLDNLRSNGSKWSSDLLPELTEHVDSVSTGAMPALEQAAQAGVSFTGNGAASGPKADVLVGIAHDLAEAVVGPLRRRLSDDDGVEGSEESVVVEHVGSAFREWRGERIERLAGDQVVAAFSAGTIAAAQGKKPLPLEWVAVGTAGDEPCPDCEDNGLNGSQPPGEEFPTGHRHPPAHPGCRCLLAPAAT